MKIGLLLEGPTDEGAVKVLVRRILGSESSPPAVVVRKLKGHGNLLKQEKVEGVVRALSKAHGDIDKIVGLVDKDCKPGRAEQARAIENYLSTCGIRPSPCYCVVVQALEGWLTSDPDAVSKVLGVQASRVRFLPPEDDCDPAESLRRTFKKFKRSFNKMVDNPKIVELLDLDRTALKNPSFSQFRQLVQDP